jgi:hypothetical protein
MPVNAKETAIDNDNTFVLHVVIIVISSRVVNLVKDILLYLPKLLGDSCFRMPEQLMNKALFFIKGYSLKKERNEEHYLLRHPQQGWFINAFCCVIDLDNGTTVLFNQCLA